MLKQLLTIALALGALSAPASAPRWLEADSAQAIMQRTRADFPYTVDEYYELIKAKDPSFTREQLREYIDKKYVETLTFDGVERVFRKAPGNMKLLNPATNGGWKHRGSQASAARISYVDSVVRQREGKNPLGAAHKVVYRFSVDVPYNSAIDGELLSVWMPVPMATQRQHSFRLLSASPAQYVMSDGKSDHNTICFHGLAPQPGDTAHFEYVAEFVTEGEYFPADEILAKMKPYNKKSKLYKEYTAMEAPHIIRLDSLAHAIVGDETNPFRQSELVYDYIIRHYPWAGAREYSTIPCIPQYVVEQGHGDCGQVSLLYISLMRSLGVPARWESGWMLHPGEKNLHDWAEVYFEGVGWVPVDVSFGRYTGSDDPDIRGFYSHGMDAHRFAANKGVCKEFFPRKQYVRSETVDAQMGEVECLHGNLFYPAWSRSLELISVTPVAKKKK